MVLPSYTYKLSIILTIGRESYGSLVGMEKDHILQPTLFSLKKQTRKDFELIIVDSLRERDLEEEITKLGKWDFPIKVIKAPPNYWLDNGFYSQQNLKNTGAVYSKGEYLLFADDASEFPPHYVSLALAYLSAGYLPHTLFAYKKLDHLWMRDPEAKPIYSVPEALKKGALDDQSIVMADSRWPFVMKEGGTMYPVKENWGWFYHYAFIPSRMFFLLNGYDENFDGEKTFGDIELGDRIARAGMWKMVLSQDLYCYEYHHYALPHSSFSKDASTYPIRSNWDLLGLIQQSGILRANTIPWTRDELKGTITRDYQDIDTNPSFPLYSFQSDETPYLDHQLYSIEHPAQRDLLTERHKLCI